MSLTKVTYSMISGAPVNVLDYGAKGDGVTDDTAAINAAILACKTWPSKALYFPVGTYIVSSPIVVNGPGVGASLSIYGEAQGTSVLKLADNANCSILFLDSTLSENHEFDIANLYLDGNKANQTIAAPLFESEKGYGYRLRNIRANNSKGDGFKFTGGWGAIRLLECYAFGCEGYGLYVNGAYAFTVQNGVYEYNTAGGIYFNDVQNGLIQGTYFEYNDSYDISVTASAGVNVVSNYIRADRAVDITNVLFTSSTDCAVTNNVLHFNQVADKQIIGVSFGAQTTNCTAIGNTVFRGAYEVPIGSTNSLYQDIGYNNYIDPRQSVDTTTYRLPNQIAGGFIGDTYARGYANMLLYSNDFTQAAWTKSVGTSIVLSNYGPLANGASNTTNRITFTSNTDTIKQRVTVPSYNYDVVTFSISRTARVNSGAGPLPYSKISGIAADGTTVLWTKKEFVKRGQVQTGSEVSIYPVQLRHSVSYSTDVSAAYIDVEIGRYELADNIYTANFSQAQLAFGYGIPYVETTATAYTLYGGSVIASQVYANNLTARYGTATQSLGTLSISAEVSGNTAVTLTANVTTFSITPDSTYSTPPGMEARVVFTQDGVGGRTLSSGAGNTKFASGASGIVTTAGAVSIYTFLWDGTYWRETARSLNV